MCIVLPVLAFACRKPVDNDRPPSRASLLPYFDSNALSQVLKPGLSREEILKNFGSPTFEFPLSEGLSCIEYSRFNGAEPKEPELAGFQVVIKSNRLLQWSPVYLQLSRPAQTPTNTGREGGSHPAEGDLGVPALDLHGNGLSLFLLAASRSSAEAVHVDALGTSGFVKTNPDLTLSQIITVKKVIAQDGKSYQVLLKLSASDAEALRHFSQTNVGERVLIAAAGQVVSSPTIEGPIETPTLALTVPTEAAADKIVRALSTARKP